MRILVIEDEPGIRTFVKEGLEIYAGHQVDTVADRSAIEMARTGHYELILADMHLADNLDALEIIEEVTAFDRGVQFIVMTGKKRLDVATKLVHALRGNQVASFLFKPFDLEELIIAVDRVKNGPPEPEAPRKD